MTTDQAQVHLRVQVPAAVSLEMAYTRPFTLTGAVIAKVGCAVPASRSCSRAVIVQYRGFTCLVFLHTASPRTIRYEGNVVTVM